MTRIPAAAVAILLCLLPGCGSGEEDTEEVQHLVPVSLEPVVQDSILETIGLVGRLAPPPGGEATLTAPADGVIGRIRVRIGQSVGQGASLLHVDAPDLQAQARAQRAQAVAAEREAERQRELLDAGVSARRQVEEATAAATAASAAADAAERLLGRTSITSPIAGSVQQILVNTGERVQSGDPLIQVVNGRTLTVVTTVPAPTLARLRAGMDAWIKVDGVSDSVAGSILGVSPGVDTTTNAGTVVVGMRRQPSSFRPGAGATASVVAAVHRDALVVPDSALVVVGATPMVFVLQADSTVKAFPVRVGVRSGGRVQVTGDLKPGDQVVTTGAYGLSDGMHVQAVTGAAGQRDPP